jgi:D-glycero-alpha-D-manno-heptose-7-phosphate kinase
MIVVRSPFRLPLGGGGTDLPSYYKEYEGFLITAAINKYMYININEPAIINKIKINYSKTEIVGIDEIDDIQHDIVRESLKHLKIKRPIEVHSMADLSAGTGMGSSSAYTVGLLKGFNAMLRRFIPIQELAEEACKVEIDLIGKPIGKQDQYATAFGGIIQMEIDKSGRVVVTPLNIHHETINELENRLMMFYTSIERDANEILAEQGTKIAESLERRAESKGEGERYKEQGERPKPRDYEDAKMGERSEVQGAMSHEPRATSLSAVDAMHKIKEIGYEVKKTLIEGDVTRFGELLHEHWMTKKSVTEKMSSSDIDDWYNLAMDNGALGGKIMGAGGGGFFVFCVDNGKRKHLRKTLEDAGLHYMDFKFDWEGTKVLVNI